MFPKYTHRSLFQKLAQKAYAVNGAAPRSIGTREISVGVRPDAPPPTSTSGRCQVTDEASSYASLQRRRRNPDKGAKEATRRQSSLLAPRSRFSRCKDHSECQITARQRRQRLFLHFPFDEGKGTVADKLVTTPLSLSKLGYIFFTLVENEENSVTGIAKRDKILFFLHSGVNSNM